MLGVQEPPLADASTRGLREAFARFAEGHAEASIARAWSTWNQFFDRHGERLREGGARYLVEQCFRHAGIGARVPRGAVVHALPLTFATRLAEDGATATEIQRLLGHASLNTSQGYIDATAAEQRAAARANRAYRTLERIVTKSP